MRHFHASQRTRKKNTHVRRKKKIAAGLLACLLSGVFFSQNALARHKEAAPAPAEMQQAVKALATAADEKDTKDTKNAKVAKKRRRSRQSRILPSASSRRWQKSCGNTSRRMPARSHSSRMS